jgi:hypothetical protein
MRTLHRVPRLCTRPASLAWGHQAFRTRMGGTRPSGLTWVAQGLQDSCGWQQAFRTRVDGTRPPELGSTGQVNGPRQVSIHSEVCAPSRHPSSDKHQSELVPLRPTGVPVRSASGLNSCTCTASPHRARTSAATRGEMPETHDASLAAWYTRSAKTCAVKPGIECPALPVCAGRRERTASFPWSVASSLPTKVVVSAQTTSTGRVPSMVRTKPCDHTHCQRRVGASARQLTAAAG